MTHKELVDQVSANLFKQRGKIESERSWLAMRNYLKIGRAHVRTPVTA